MHRDLTVIDLVSTEQIHQTHATEPKTNYSYYSIAERKKYKQSTNDRLGASHTMAVANK